MSLEKSLEDQLVNVICLLPTLEIGGTEQQVLFLIPYLKQETEMLLLAEEKGDLVEAAWATGAYRGSSLKGRFGFMISAATRILLVARRAKHPIIVEAFLPRMIILAALIKLFHPSKIKVIANRRSHLFYRTNRCIGSSIDKWSSKIVDITVSNSPSIKEELINSGEVEEKDIVIIENALDVAKVEKSRKQGEFPEVFVVSNHHVYKRVKDIVLSVNDLKEVSLFPRINLIGVGSETDALRELAEKLQLTNIIFHGSVNNPWKSARREDIFVHASATEGFSNSILEALARGLVCVLSDIPANRYVAGDCALYFPVGDYEKLSEILFNIVSDEAQRKKLSACAIDRIRKNFSIDTVIQARLSIYRDLMK